MKTTLHMANSVDGYVARADGSTDWISTTDAHLFETRARAAGCLLIGRTTFDQYHGELYPMAGSTNIVLTRTAKASDEEGVHYVTSIAEAFALAEKLGHSQVLVAGGGQVSGACLNEGVIDELFITVHPVALGNGIKLFEGLDESVTLDLLDTQALDEGVVQLHYAVHTV